MRRTIPPLSPEFVPEDERRRNDDDDDSFDGDEDDDKMLRRRRRAHLALADSVPHLYTFVTSRMSVRAQTPISLPSDTEVARLFAIPTLPPSPLFSLSSPLPPILSPLPQILSPPLPWRLSHENKENVLAQIQKKGFAIAALKNELRKLTGNSVNTKFAKPSILGKPVLQPHRKTVTTHYLPKRRESAHAKPHYMIAPSSSRYSSNDIVHNHYLEEAKKKTQEHSRNSRNFSDSKHFVCSTCQKCVFNANHDSCVTKFLNEVNSRAKVPSNKTTKRYIPAEQTSFAKKPERQIPKRHKSSIKKTSVVHEKTMTPRSCLRWKPTGKLFKTVGLKWIPTGKIFTSSTTKVDSEPPNGSKEDITNQCESEQALDVSADISENRASRNFDLMINKMTFEHSSSGLVLHQMVSAENNTSGPVPQCSNDVCSHQFRPRSLSNDF
ncbi:hypothetical protein Tco_0725018 [Tanacetum coccineum]|uniref:Uncharacterized protein n=1 Tax=Tanacetum coccineum TaxID=301880 RepID=A0ABQ4YCL4_9ASTR